MYIELLERASSKDMTNACKGEFGGKLYLDEITSITCVPKEKQVSLEEI